MARILFGLDRLPRSLAADDPRLPGVPAAGGLLRLNTEPLPAAALPAAALPAAVLAGAPGDHAARLAALLRWLEGLCGDYAAARRRFVAAYVALLAASIAARRAELAAGLARFDGLYAPEDWIWSAPRPLPRAWLPGPDGPVFAEMAFRLADGPLALVLAEPAREAALVAAGVRVRRVGTDVLAAGPAALAAALGEGFWRFEAGEKLPMGAFRRGVGAVVR